MYAIVRETTYDESRLAQGQAQLDEFNAAHARQPGFRGTLAVDLGGGRWLNVNLWETEEAAAAALPLMIPVVKQLLEPMIVGESRLVGAGPVVQADLQHVR